MCPTMWKVTARTPPDEWSRLMMERRDGFGKLRRKAIWVGVSVGLVAAIGQGCGGNGDDVGGG
jgi:hypothetical protein